MSQGKSKRRVLRLGGALLIMGLVWVWAPSRVEAAYECGGVEDTCNCGVDNFCICCSDASHGTDHGNCVWYGWHKACCVWGIGLEWCTNANTWDTWASDNGYPVNGEACANTVFVCESNTTECWSGGVGHVGWVTHVYPSGAVDVEEQGCYGWYGVRTRTFDAQNASPPMNYIYEPGTSCVECECDPGETESDTCGFCGTQTRTCGSDCFWEAWGACQNEGECEEGSTQSCGGCGTQTCQPGCTWGACDDPCDVDASVPPPDAAVLSDASHPTDASVAVDSGIVVVDSGAESDSGSNPTPDASSSQGMSSGYRGGCGCRQVGSFGQTGLPWGHALLTFLFFTLLGFSFRRFF